MRVLVTGATGYVGSRLVPELLERGHDVIAAGRRPEALAELAWADRVETRYLDVHDTVSVHLALRDVDAVFYLVHSMADGDFVRRDRHAAESLVAAADYRGVQRIVYLSGLVPDIARRKLSDHLSSRLEVEEILLDGPTPAVVLRASMVVGAGSTSFEVLRRLTERLPITTVPTWMRARIQPVAIEDVVTVLAAALDGEVRNRHYDLGGDQVLTYAELLTVFAEAAGLRRVQVPVPIAPVSIVGEAVALLSGIPRGTATALVRSLPHDMVCHDDDVRRDLVPGHRFLTLDEALTRSLQGDTRATSIDGDVQGEAATDPAWVGSLRS